VDRTHTKGGWRQSAIKSMESRRGSQTTKTKAEMGRQGSWNETWKELVWTAICVDSRRENNQKHLEGSIKVTCTPPYKGKTFF